MATKKEKIDLLVKVFENLRTLINHADSKAGVALALQMFMMTSLLGSQLITETMKHLSVIDDVSRRGFFILLTLFFFAALGTIICCVLVFTPRNPQEDVEHTRKGITYFSHINAWGSSAAYLEAIKALDDDDIMNEFACQNFSLGRIVDYKMYYAKLAVFCLFVSMFFGTLLLLFTFAHL